MSFDNRPVNRQAHAHPLRFHGIKAIENTLQIRWIQARPRITIKTKVDPGLVKASPSLTLGLLVLGFVADLGDLLRAYE